jgi:hypothetical protein
VDIKARLFRNYPYGELGSHLIGYIGRINTSEKEVIDDSDDEANYRGTEYIGKLGVEQSYESELHGQTGFEEVETSAGGRAVRRLKSNAATPGNTVVLSIDIPIEATSDDYERAVESLKLAFPSFEVGFGSGILTGCCAMPVWGAVSLDEFAHLSDTRFDALCEVARRSRSSSAGVRV